jgi:predicted HicB family RNase H-like nuclease
MQFHLRLPELLKLQLQEKARENGRSLNAEIVHRLMRSLDTGRYRP